MVMVEIDSNAILVEPMKSRKDEEMIHAYNALLLRLKRAGIVPKKHVLDNEVSENMKNHICDTCKFDMELVPPGCHRRNAAEVAIRNFKAHFLSVLAGVADDFPPSLWDRLLPQTEITTFTAPRFCGSSHETATTSKRHGPPITTHHTLGEQSQSSYGSHGCRHGQATQLQTINAKHKVQRGMESFISQQIWEIS